MNPLPKKILHKLNQLQYLTHNDLMSQYPEYCPRRAVYMKDESLRRTIAYRLQEAFYGGFSGSNTERPALKELLVDIEAGQVDVVVVYKIDRLSRSLIDFASLQTLFDKHHVSFVSVTQQIDTSTSAGRMMLNILMTFAQFERECIADRIRDKFAASRKKGIWMGGSIPYGYNIVDKKLIINEKEAPHAKWIFERYAEITSAKQVALELNNNHILRTNGKKWCVHHIYRVLGNYTYLGKVHHKGNIYEGEHKGIITQELWDEVHKLLQENTQNKSGDRTQFLAPLKGILRCGHCGGAMTPTYSVKNGRRYTYYECIADTKRATRTCPIRRISAEVIENIVYDELGKVLQSNAFLDILAKQSGECYDTIHDSLANLPVFWNELFPVERNRIIELLFETITVNQNGIDMTLKTKGLNSLIKEMKYDNH